MSVTSLALASDHGGVQLKGELVSFLEEVFPQLSIIDLGTHGDSSVDYPDFGHAMADAITSGQASVGILVCGSGIGISMAANRHKGVRAALVYDEETAMLAKAHNNANVLCLGGRKTSVDDAKKLVSTWLNTEFEGGRHEGRIAKLDS